MVKRNEHVAPTQNTKDAYEQQHAARLQDEKERLIRERLTKYVFVGGVTFALVSWVVGLMWAMGVFDKRIRDSDTAWLDALSNSKVICEQHEHEHEHVQR